MLWVKIGTCHGILSPNWNIVNDVSRELVGCCWHRSQENIGLRLPGSASLGPFNHDDDDDDVVDNDDDDDDDDVDDNDDDGYHDFFE